MKKYLFICLSLATLFNHGKPNKKQLDAIRRAIQSNAKEQEARLMAAQLNAEEQAIINKVEEQDPRAAQASAAGDSDTPRETRSEPSTPRGIFGMTGFSNVDLDYDNAISARQRDSIDSAILWPTPNQAEKVDFSPKAQLEAEEEARRIKAQLLNEEIARRQEAQSNAENAAYERRDARRPLLINSNATSSVAYPISLSLPAKRGQGRVRETALARETSPPIDLRAADSAARPNSGSSFIRSRPGGLTRTH